jgi:GWxTD domain-containing protein
MTRSSIRTLVVSLALAASAAGAFAAAAQKYADWAAGPAQWLMTRQDSSAWKKVQTDGQAQKFIDLFWARRDPTPGTPRNEFHEAFDARVQFADANFGETNRRGALTQRGRIVIVMGEWSSRQVLAAAPAGAGNQSFNTLSGQSASTQGDHNREHWVYEGEAAKRLGIYPRSATVYFVQDDSSKHIWQMDVQKIGEWAVAQDNGVKLAIVNPDLTEAPVYGEDTPTEVAPVQMKGMTTTRTRRVVLPDAPVVKDSLTGVTSLLLTRSNAPVGSPAAPFVPSMFTQDATSGALRLTPNDELAWAFEIRNPGEEAIDQPKIEVAVDVNGTINGEAVHMSSPADIIPADPMRKTPGHFTVRGSIPLSEFAPGTYTLALHVRDAVKNETFKLQRQFVVVAR